MSEPDNGKKKKEDSNRPKDEAGKIIEYRYNSVLENKEILMTIEEIDGSVSTTKIMEAIRECESSEINRSFYKFEDESTANRPLIEGRTIPLNGKTKLKIEVMYEKEVEPVEPKMTDEAREKLNSKIRKRMDERKERIKSDVGFVDKSFLKDETNPIYNRAKEEIKRNVKHSSSIKRRKTPSHPRFSMILLKLGTTCTKFGEDRGRIIYCGFGEPDPTKYNYKFYKDYFRIPIQSLFSIGNPSTTTLEFSHEKDEDRRKYMQYKSDLNFGSSGIYVEANGSYTNQSRNQKKCRKQSYIFRKEVGSVELVFLRSCGSPDRQKKFCDCPECRLRSTPKKFQESVASAPIDFMPDDEFNKYQWFIIFHENGVDVLSKFSLGGVISLDIESERNSDFDERKFKAECNLQSCKISSLIGLGTGGGGSASHGSEATNKESFTKSNIIKWGGSEEDSETEYMSIENLMKNPNIISVEKTPIYRFFGEKKMRAAQEAYDYFLQNPPEYVEKITNEEKGDEKKTENIIMTGAPIMTSYPHTIPKPSKVGSCFGRKTYYSHKDYYIGDFCDGKRHGMGCYHWRTPDIKRRGKYTGQFKNGEFHGYGTKILKSRGKTYEGYWKEGKKHGKGKTTYDKGEVVSHEGEWKDGKKDGPGLMIYRNGDKFEGVWKDNKRNGRGIHVYSNGDVFRGEWVGRWRHGKGILVQSSDGSSIEQEWENGKKKEMEN